MSITVPLAALNEVMERHRDRWGGNDDIPLHVVREYAADLRGERPGLRAIQTRVSARDRAEADDLDALANRIEKEARA